MLLIFQLIWMANKILVLKLPIFQFQAAIMSITTISTSCEGDIPKSWQLNLHSSKFQKFLRLLLFTFECNNIEDMHLFIYLYSMAHFKPFTLNNMEYAYPVLVTYFITQGAIFVFISFTYKILSGNLFLVTYQMK